MTGPAVQARAVFIPVEERPEIWRLFTAKYGLELMAIMGVERILRLLPVRRFRRQGDRVNLELSVTTA